MAKLQSLFFKGHPQNIRKRLLRDIIFLVAITFCCLVALSIYQARTVRKKVSKIIISDAATLVKKRVSRFLDPVENYLTVISEWKKNGAINQLNDQELTKLFIPLLSAHAQIAGLLIANSNGAEFFLQQYDGGWRSRRLCPGDGERISTWRSWHPDAQPCDVWQEKTDYQSANRPWYKEALTKEPGKIGWTEPYTFFTAQEIGVTAAIHWQEEDDRDSRHVIAIDLLENDLLEFLNTLQAAEDGHIIVIGKDGSVIAYNKFEPGKVDQRPAPLEAALKIWQSHKEKEVSALEFTTNDQVWWAGFSKLGQGDPSSWIGIIIPQSKIMDNVVQKWRQTGILGIAVLIFAIFLAFRLVKKYSYQLKDLPTQHIDSHNFTNELMALIDAGESTTLEFKSTLRTNLKTGKKGKEIEIAWLKTITAFMNSDGGILLVGIEDDGNILGIQADNFENEDKLRLYCKSLINNHIGPEFARFINLKLKLVKEKQIVVIECERVRKPVFLSIGKNEDFFIRSGPSSMKITMSQMVKYLEERR
jgi:hypothetical protein